ncbi:NADPH-dependent FMN reductase [Saccharopolyspora mangrovi]|uniref:NAD(P)H-dependent oxidoreductase n=1 Tax=Saccharopolyspora mangrovi TaxID=3082379 RepID=A0ABU6AJR2_9PSEU|nr:NAD(P)H-dependent oxidoreductase [Saccharopolyspora sp. S2-29]MEB3371550.1 NAD(P)H-dependent oxidoreductase [Saccharopolyspora sp. S2-29]
MSANARPDHTDPIKLVVIIGSVREGRFGLTVGKWFADQAAGRHDLSVDIVDLDETTLPLAMTKPTPGTAHALADLSPRIEAADAFVVVTPEYNHSFPAALKNAIDWHHAEWQAKPVGFVCYGGISGGLRAVEQLRLVFAELHAVTIRDTVSFHNAWSQFDGQGQPVSPEGCNGAAKTLLDQLTWWSQALREARTVRPYVA